MKIEKVEYFCDVCDCKMANQEIEYKIKSRYRCVGRWMRFMVCQDCYDKFVRMGEEAERRRRREMEK